MFKHFVMCCALVTCTAFGHVRAQSGKDNSLLPAKLQAAPQAQVGQTPGAPRLKDIEAWLAVQFKLPAASVLPTIQFASTAQITTFRYTGMLSEQPQHRALVPPGQRHVVATYDPDTYTIYLPKGWTGRTPAEMSILVHEMVHHLQNTANLKYACRHASEELAYAAQEKWLGRFGRSLEKDFGLDPFTLLASTLCLY